MYRYPPMLAGKTEEIGLSSPQPTLQSKLRIWRRAEEYAREVNFLPGDSIEPLVERLGGTISYLGTHDSFFADDGSLNVYGPQFFEIRISGLTGAERDRFTIAHELGHYVLHSEMGKRPIVASRSGSNRVEWEANWFAAAFLMPEADFKEACIVCDNFLHLVAARFIVSSRAAEVRMESLGIAPRK
jgi:predicted transcriptional regulator